MHVFIVELSSVAVGSGKIPSFNRISFHLHRAKGETGLRKGIIGY